MTDLSTPAEVNGEVSNVSTAHALEKAGGHTGYVVDGVDIASFYSSLSTTDINGFVHQSSTGLDVTFAGGEAYCAGWFCRDRTTTITLPASSTTTIYAGFDLDDVLDLSLGESSATNENVIIGPASAFSAEFPRLPLYEFTTDGSSVTGVTDLRELGRPQIGAEAISELAIDTSKDWGGHDITNAGTISASTVDAATIAGVSVNNLSDLEGANLSVDSTGVLNAADTGADAISELAIDVDKDWGGYKITNAGRMEPYDLSFSHANTIYIGALNSGMQFNTAGNWYFRDGGATRVEIQNDGYTLFNNAIEVANNSYFNSNLWVGGVLSLGGTNNVTSDDTTEIFVQSTEPSSPSTGDLWIDTS